MAGHLGKTVGEIRRGMSYRELLGWEVFFSRIEVMPDSAREAAQICAVVANSNRSKGPPARVRDFIPRVGSQQTTEQMRLAFEQATGG